MAGAASSRGKTATSKTSGRSSPRSEELLPPLVVRYMRRMKPQRVYSWEVSWQTARRRLPPAGPVVVRLLLAGAQVVPSEHTLDPSEPKTSAVFYVTPLARGGLRGGRLEILQAGKKVQEMKLPARAVSQRLTGILLALTFLVPWFLMTYISPKWEKRVPIRGQEPGTTEVRVMQIPPGKKLEETLEPHLPPVLDVVDDKVPDVGNSLRDVLPILGSSVNYVHFKLEDLHLLYWTTAGLLGLTLLSAFVHRAKRKRRISQPLPLPQPDLDL